MTSTKTAQLLPLRPRPKEQELLSSWIIRLARANGLKAQSFVRLISEGTSFWSRDPDRYVSTAVLRALSDRTALPENAIEGLTLRSFDGTVTRACGASARAQWILPLGVFHRVRRLFGLMACTDFLHADPYYKKEWRLALTVACPTHKVWLIDRCPYCSSPLMLHRSDQGSKKRYECGVFERCSACDRTFPLGEEAPAAVIHGQMQLRQVLLGEHNKIGSINCSPFEFLLCLRIMIGLLCIERGQLESEERASLFEALSVRERAPLILSGLRLLGNWPTGVKDFLGSSGLRPSIVSRYNYAPRWMYQALIS